MTERTVSLWALLSSKLNWKVLQPEWQQRSLYLWHSLYQNALFPLMQLSSPSEALNAIENSSRHTNSPPPCSLSAVSNRTTAISLPCSEERPSFKPVNSQTAGRLIDSPADLQPSTGLHTAFNPDNSLGPLTADIELAHRYVANVGSQSGPATNLCTKDAQEGINRPDCEVCNVGCFVNGGGVNNTVSLRAPTNGSGDPNELGRMRERHRSLSTSDLDSGQANCNAYAPKLYVPTLHLTVGQEEPCTAIPGHENGQFVYSTLSRQTALPLETSVKTLLAKDDEDELFSTGEGDLVGQRLALEGVLTGQEDDGIERELVSNIHTSDVVGDASYQATSDACRRRLLGSPSSVSHAFSIPHVSAWQGSCRSDHRISPSTSLTPFTSGQILLDLAQSSSMPIDASLSDHHEYLDYAGQQITELTETSSIPSSQEQNSEWMVKSFADAVPFRSDQLCNGSFVTAVTELPSLSSKLTLEANRIGDSDILSNSTNGNLTSQVSAHLNKY
ncbi:unnamed protein product [Protopolystoma xenopodis]|uniref:Uncharacterized protein n=1 Tax=Protopolystoma xenopodis TaxID=117903 RepID=A0A448WE19_9PLAT|nr:unnamed protein product [Protopolystoma xenopodis]